MTTLAPRRPGGIEKDVKPSTGDDMEADEDEEDAAGPSSTGAIPKGYGRIVRDAEGNVVDIVMGGEEGADSEDESAPKADKGKARAEDTPVVAGASALSRSFRLCPHCQLTSSGPPPLTSSRVDRGPDGQAPADGNWCRAPLPQVAPGKARLRRQCDGARHACQPTPADARPDRGECAPGRRLGGCRVGGLEREGRARRA